MYLDTTSKTLEIILSAAKTTNDCEFTADYIDTQSGTTFAPANVIGLSNGTGAVTAVGSPAASTQRKISAFTFYNADTVNTTVTVRVYDGTNRRRVIVVTLTPGQSLVFTPEAGWSILQSTLGQIPGTQTNDSAAAGNIGEFQHILIPTGSAMNVSALTATNIGSVNLTAGDWNSSGIIAVNPPGGTTPSLCGGSISPNSATLESPGATDYSTGLTQLAGVAGGGIWEVLCLGRISLATTTTVYLVAYVNFSGAATIPTYGQAMFRRVR